MSKRIFIATFAIFLASCAADGQRIGDKMRAAAINQVIEFANSTRNYLLTHSEETAIQLAKERVASGLKDPESAQFRSVRVSNFRGDKVICGEVNAKNSYGGYVGFKRFVASPFDAKMESFGNRYEEFDRIYNLGLSEACN